MILKAICTGLVSETAGSDTSLLHISVACKIRIVIAPWTRSCLCSSWLIFTEIPLYFRGTKAGGSSADGHTTPPLPHPQQPLPQQAPTQIATHAHVHTHTHTRTNRHTHAHYTPILIWAWLTHTLSRNSAFAVTLPFTYRRCAWNRSLLQAAVQRPLAVAVMVSSHIPNTFRALCVLEQSLCGVFLSSSTVSRIGKTRVSENGHELCKL